MSNLAKSRSIQLKQIENWDMGQVTYIQVFTIKSFNIKKHMYFKMPLNLLNFLDVCIFFQECNFLYFLSEWIKNYIICWIIIFTMNVFKSILRHFID